MSNRDVLDTIVSSETPEGIYIELQPAGMPARCTAFVIDWGIRMMLFSIMSTVLRLLGGVGVGLALAGFFLLEWFYPVACELSRWGATPGKKAMNLKVVMDNGLPITPAASLTRNLLRVVDFMPMLFGFGIVSTLWRRDCKRVGDIVAATLVVYQPAKLSTPKLEDLPAVAPQRTLTLEDQAALLAMAARAKSLTSARLNELALLAAPVIGMAVNEHTPHEVVTRRVLGVAQWLMGKRT
jgi:uncharacterized RDD family membrane protein YckC